MTTTTTTASKRERTMRRRVKRARKIVRATLRGLGRLREAEAGYGFAFTTETPGIDRVMLRNALPHYCAVYATRDRVRVCVHPW
jgi:hypothetical protein